MTHPHPRLVVAPPVPAAQEPSDDSRGGTRQAFWVLAALVFACALAAAFQTQRVNELNVEVAALTGELATARSDLAAYQGHLVEIRGAVTQLQTQLGELDELARRDPVGDPAR